ncbi:hypothetical protein AVEN_119765-1 [Araneus ventricosus]|uniref:Histone-lysine N-methyltransferase SETMAR n=1 Tax=Araneus ventricosus TaxID=182803 RepID=A0A4Y2VVQ0_ARAVE|nr:hypothetical protein AVEN_119765-1 [Araneus ventricosus]
MADRIDAPAKFELRSVTRFLQAEGCAVVTLQSLDKFKQDVSDHPLYSPDLASSDFHFFPELKNWLGGQNFQKNDSIQRKVKAHLTSLVATFFEEGIENLVHRYEKWLKLHDKYAEK